MHALLLAVTQELPPSPSQNEVSIRPLIVLTDSKSALTELKHCQRKVFRKFVTPRDTQSLLCQLVTALNHRASSRPLLLIKVRAHCGHCLNERADELANQAALLEPPAPPRGPSLECRFRINDVLNPTPWSRWNPRLSAIATQNFARAQFAQLEIRWPPRQLAAPPQPTVEQWLLTHNAGRALLGQTLRGMQLAPPLKRALQSISHTYPTMNTLHLWGKKDSPLCPLGTCTEVETLAHLQCGCPHTKAARIAVHHAIWGSLVRHLRLLLPPKEALLLQEITIPSMARALEVEEPYAAEKEQWQQAVASLSEATLESDAPLDQRAPSTPHPAGQAGPGTTAHTPRTNKRRQRGTETTVESNVPNPALPPRKRRKTHPLRTSQARADSALHDPPHPHGEPGPATAPSQPKHAPLAVTKPPPSVSQGSARRKRKPFIPRARPEAKPPTARQTLRVTLMDKQRPDGLLLNWKAKSFFILEFTRAYDPDLQALRIADEQKTQRYARLCNHLQARLPGWSGRVMPFTIGIRGTMNEATWMANLEALSIPGDKQYPIMKAALKTALDGLDTVFLARNGQRQQETPTAHHDHQAPGSSDNPGETGPGPPTAGNRENSRVQGCPAPAATTTTARTAAEHTTTHPASTAPPPPPPPPTGPVLPRTQQ
jgi:hypothetical protein